VGTADKKRVFCGMCIEKRLGLLWAKVKETVVSALRKMENLTP